MIAKMKYNMDNTWAVILAAGKGKRMNAKTKNKVTYKIAGEPMILRTLKIIRNTGIKNILVVVGFAKESVISLLDSDIKTVEQKRRLGTGHALNVALKKIPAFAENVLVLNGDDSFLYSPDILNKLFKHHCAEGASITFLTTEIDNPTGLGRIIRNTHGNVLGIVEEKDATDEQKKVKEINTASYIFSVKFLRKYINSITKSKITGEYYIPSLIEKAYENSEKIETVKLNSSKWRGVNTINELEEAEKYFHP